MTDEKYPCSSDDDCPYCCFLGLCLKSSFCTETYTSIECLDDADCSNGCCYMGKCESTDYCGKRGKQYDDCDETCESSCCFAEICPDESVCTWLVTGYVMGTDQDKVYEIVQGVVIGGIILILAFVVVAVFTTVIIVRRRKKQKKGKKGTIYRATIKLNDEDLKVVFSNVIVFSS